MSSVLVFFFWIGEAGALCFEESPGPGPFASSLAQLEALDGGSFEEPGLIHYRRLNVEGEPLVIGVQKQLLIKASFESAKALLEGFQDYPAFQPGVLETTLVEDGNQKEACRFFEVEWIRQAPLPLLPQPKYRLRYGEEVQASRLLIQHHLLRSKSLDYSDGFVGLTKVDDSHVLFHVRDIFKARWGMLGRMAKEHIWHASLAGGFRGDWAFKVRLEEPGLDKDGVAARIKTMLDQEEKYTKVLPPLTLKGGK
jgi:hypothetical protein